LLVRAAKVKLNKLKREFSDLLTKNQELLFDLEDLGGSLRYKTVKIALKTLIEVQKLAETISLKLKELAKLKKGGI